MPRRMAATRRARGRGCAHCLAAHSGPPVVNPNPSRAADGAHIRRHVFLRRLSGEAERDAAVAAADLGALGVVAGRAIVGRGDLLGQARHLDEGSHPGHYTGGKPQKEKPR